MGMTTPRELSEWCQIPYQELKKHLPLKVILRLYPVSQEIAR